jgi:nucleosome binding factor SPN SPT16 subunit
MIDCAAPTKTPERGARVQEVVSPTKKLEDKAEKERKQHKKKAEKKDMKNSLKYLTGSSEDAFNRLMTQEPYE